MNNYSALGLLDLYNKVLVVTRTINHWIITIT